jgi:hypothetical protein
MRPPLISDWVDANLRRIRAMHQFTLSPDDCWARREAPVAATGEMLDHGDASCIRRAYAAQHEVGLDSWQEQKDRAYYLRGVGHKRQGHGKR